MPAAHESRALSTLLLVMSVFALHVAGAPPHSRPGRELHDARESSALATWERHTLLLIADVSSLRDQLLRELNLPELKDSVDLRLELPDISESDCASSDLHEEKCLLSISQGLERYSVYLQLVERENSALGVSKVRVGTKALVDHVTALMKDLKFARGPTPAQPDRLLSALRADNPWDGKKTAHGLLRGYWTFLTDTLRALRCRAEGGCV